MNNKEYLENLGNNSLQASKEIKPLSTDEKNALLNSIISCLKKDMKSILEANRKDIELCEEKISKAMVDRLLLNEERFNGIIKSIENVISLSDPVGNILLTNKRPNGMVVERISVPLGVIGIIYESRPNVTVDATVLCLKAGNSVILRGGSECFNTNTALVNSMRNAFKLNSFNENIIQYIETTDRAAVDFMLAEMTNFIDVIVPRGGKGLVKKVQDTAKIPVIGHLDGICHIYVDKSSKPSEASKIVENAKLRRTGICGAAETLLVDRDCVDTHLPEIIKLLSDGGCEIRGDETCKEKFPNIKIATEEDWKQNI